MYVCGCILTCTWYCTSHILYFPHPQSVDAEGNIKARVANPAISNCLLSEVLSWNQEGARIEDVVARLRMRTVPSGYTIHNWIDGIYNFRN